MEEASPTFHLQSLALSLRTFEYPPHVGISDEHAYSTGMFTYLEREIRCTIENVQWKLTVGQLNCPWESLTVT